MHKIYWLFFSFCLGNSSIGQAKNMLPPLPYLDWGACPFECCTYQSWTAIQSINAFKDRDEHSKVVFKLIKNTRVQALTGVVVTEKAGDVMLLKPVKLGYNKVGEGPVLSLKTGEHIYPLHPMGEGFEAFWYQGKVYYDDLYAYHPSLRQLKPAQFTWWAKLRNQQRQIGWTKHTNLFQNQDACG